MRNLFLTTMIFAASFMSIFAQTDVTTYSQNDTPAPQFGVKGGVNISTLTSDDFDDPDSRTSFNAGVFLEIPLNDRFSIQPEVLYSEQGFTIKQNDQDNLFDTDENYEYQLSYIQVPIMAKVYLVKGLNIEVGPQFGFKVNEEFDFQPTTDDGDIEIEDEDSYIKDFDTSVAFGAGYKFDNGLFFNARYTLGLTNIFEDNTILGDVDAKNAVWQFGLGFAF